VAAKCGAPAHNAIARVTVKSQSVVKLKRTFARCLGGVSSSPEQYGRPTRFAALKASDHVVSHEWIYRFIDTAQTPMVAEALTWHLRKAAAGHSTETLREEHN